MDQPFVTSSSWPVRLRGRRAARARWGRRCSGWPSSPSALAEPVRHRQHALAGPPRRHRAGRAADRGVAAAAPDAGGAATWCAPLALSSRCGWTSRVPQLGPPPAARPRAVTDDELEPPVVVAALLPGWSTTGWSRSASGCISCTCRTTWRSAAVDSCGGAAGTGVGDGVRRARHRPVAGVDPSPACAYPPGRGQRRRGATPVPGLLRSAGSELGVDPSPALAALVTPYL